MGQHLRRVMVKFEEIKQAFGKSTAPKDNFIELPSAVRIEDDLENGIQDGELRIGAEEMEELFRECLDEIWDLIAGQMLLVESAGSTARAVFVTGGFAENEHFLQKIRSFAHERNGTQVHRGSKAQAAVMIGAVAKGMGFGLGDLSIVTPCPQSFGTLLVEDFEAWRHGEFNAFIDQADGTKKISSDVRWMIRRDEPIISDHTKQASRMILRRFPVAAFRGKATFATTLISCSERRLPQSIDKVGKRKHNRIEKSSQTLTRPRYAQDF